jgi:membrane fusion protein, copper/silver efflux system
MKIRYRVLILLLAVVGSFLAGSWITFQGSRNETKTERRILHYVDPMNPALKSDKPGIAPCGMPLEPVYADQSGSASAGGDLRATMPPGTIRILPEKQQLIGVKVATVEKAPWSHTLRVLGRVTPDETLTYRINAAVNGLIEDALPVTTGTLVKKDELLAAYSFYAAEFRTALLAYFNIVRSSATLSNAGSGEATPPGGITRAKELRTREYENIRLTGRGDAGPQREYYRQILVSYGFGETQLAQMERTLSIPEVVEIRAPAAGFVLSRNVSLGLRFDRGAELYRIADLSRVWVLADIFETEASFFKPGLRVRMELPYQKKTLYAQVSSVLPQFDPATRTLKVRLVAENPGYALRPDMFVNVELPVEGPPAVIVPVDAVIDSGLKKTVFVDRGNGFFEPRQVETGRLLGDRVEIVRGVMPGEKMVISGNFLIDSEARMQQVASGIIGKAGRDPVCGMNIDEGRAKAEGNMRQYRDQTFFFCSPQCRDEFGKDPQRYLKSAPKQGGMTTASLPDAGTKRTSHVHEASAVPSIHGTKGPSDAPHGGMLMPVPPDAGPMAGSAVPLPGPQDAMRTAVQKPGEVQTPATSAPGMNMGSQPPPMQGPMPMQPVAVPMPGNMTMPGPENAAPIIGSKGERLPPPPVTETPDAK